MEYDRISKTYNMIIFIQLYSLFLFKLEKYFDKNRCIEDVCSVIALETEVVIESILTVRKSCKLVNVSVSPLLNVFN